MPVWGSRDRARRVVLEGCSAGLGLGWLSVITVGPMLWWDFQCVDLAVLGASLKSRGISAKGCAFWGLRYTKGLFSAAAEAWEVLLGLGTSVVLGPMEEASQPRVTLSLPTVTSPPCHLLGHQSGPGAAGSITAQLL